MKEKLRNKIEDAIIQVILILIACGLMTGLFFLWSLFYKFVIA